MNKTKFRINGKEVTREQFRRKKIGGQGVPMVNDAYSKPLNSLGLGCHPDQVAERNQFFQDQKIDAVQLANGECQINSRQARNKLLKAFGFRDNDAGYGDYAGEH